MQDDNYEDDVGVEEETGTFDLDDNSHQACYIFTSAEDYELEDEDGRPTKRRKTDDDVENTRWPGLLKNADDGTSQYRQELFHEFWQRKQEVFASLVPVLPEHVIEDVGQRILDAPKLDPAGKLMTMFVTVNPGAVATLSVASRFRNASSWNSDKFPIIELFARQCSSLQHALRTFIRLTITALDGAETYHSFINEHKKLVFANYDLELLELFMENQETATRLVLVLENVEEYPAAVLNGLIRTLHLWRDRIPVLLVLKINTTVQLLESRMPGDVVNLLQPIQYDSNKRYDWELDFLKAAQRPESLHGQSVAFFLGPATVSSISDIVRDAHTSMETLSAMLMYIYMTHFFANPLSALLHPQNTTSDVLASTSSQLVQAIRNADSFGPYCRYLLEHTVTSRSGQHTRSELVASLLEDTQQLLTTVAERIEVGRAAYNSAWEVIECLTVLHTRLGRTGHFKGVITARSALETYADLSNAISDLSQSAIFLELCAAFLTPGAGLAVAYALSGLQQEQIVNVKLLDFSNHIYQRTHTTYFMENIDDADRENMTWDAFLSLCSLELANGLVNGGVENTSEVSLDEFKKVVDDSSFDISDPQWLLHEAYISSNMLLAQTKQAFQPRQRQTVERALGKPHDYLSCDCCADDSGTKAKQGQNNRGPQPPASVLFTLLQEAGQTINVRDMFEAFTSRLEPRSGNIGAGAERNIISDPKAVMALFYRALAELRMIGMVKSSTGTTVKRKSAKSGAATNDVDFIAKTSWQGL